VGVAMVVVESAVTSIYVCYAEDPLLIHKWDPEFFNQISETLNQRLQHRSKRVREVLTHNQLDNLVRSNSSLHSFFFSSFPLFFSFLTFCACVCNMITVILILQINIVCSWLPLQYG
ncbi:hypothetical protein PIB30_091641, partial [Stylosanthes scabra]|nr:hypothetical protein [Stylosanthes scabra]